MESLLKLSMFPEIVVHPQAPSLAYMKQLSSQLGHGLAKPPDKDDVGVSNTLATVCREEKISAPAGLDDLI